MKQLPAHPLQSPEWGEFRENIGTTIVRVDTGFQMSLHPLSKLPWNIGYIPKCPMPTKEIVDKLKQIGKQNNCIFIKLEPNTLRNQHNNIANEQFSNSTIQQLNKSLVKSPHSLFTNYSFHIDLTKSEEELLKQMRSKTRYNIKIAQKHNVTVKEDNSDKAFESYIELSKLTWKRQKFLAHGEEYHRKMWKVMRKADIAHLLIAQYNPTTNDQEPKTLTAWILFLHNNILYYPYGASSQEHKNVMASNLMMWEAMRWGKKNGATLFDLWGALGLEPDKSDPWYGFHRFKQGYGGELVEFVGSFDLVLNKPLYKLFNIVHPVRQKLLGL